MKYTIDKQEKYCMLKLHEEKLDSSVAPGLKSELITLHAEGMKNIILVLEQNVVVRVLLKDIAEEAVLMDPTRELPEAARRIAATVPAELQRLSIFTDIFDGIFRYLSQILLEQANYPEERFWRQVAASLHAYRQENPATRAAFDRHQFFAPEFRHSCLNRLQLRNHRQMVDLTDPAAALQFAGTLKNPIARYAAGPERSVPS